MHPGYVSTDMTGENTHSKSDHWRAFLFTGGNLFIFWFYRFVIAVLVWMVFPLCHTMMTFVWYCQPVHQVCIYFMEFLHDVVDSIPYPLWIRPPNISESCSWFLPTNTSHSPVSPPPPCLQHIKDGSQWMTLSRAFWRLLRVGRIWMGDSSHSMELKFPGDTNDGHHLWLVFYPRGSRKSVSIMNSTE
jgi:hypothetical protein